MPKLLTKRKAKWTGQFKPKVLRGSPLNPNISDAVRYQEKLYKLIARMTFEVEKQIKEFFSTEQVEQYFTMDDNIGSQARILTNALTSRFNKLFAEKSKLYAEQMANNADKSSTTALHISLKELSGGLSLKTSSITQETKDILNATVTENVALIKSISNQYLNGVQQAVMRSITTGNGLVDLIPYLQKHKGMTKRRARLIAYDQTRKAFNNLSKNRMEKLGVKDFEWLHTAGSSHPRQYHIELSGKIFSFDKLPIIDKNTGERGIPGQLPSCRCKMVPVIKFDEV